VRPTMAGLQLRNDVYRRPLATALERLGLAPGWRCADVGAGGGDVSVALAQMVGRHGRVYAVDADPARRDEVAEAAAGAGTAQVVAVTQAAEDLVLPERVQMAFCRFLLMHVRDPVAVLRRMAAVTAADGWVVAQEPVTSAGRVAGVALSMPGARHPDVGALLPALAVQAGLRLVDAWAEAPAWAGVGPVAGYLEELTGVDPGDDPVVLPPLVTVVAAPTSWAATSPAPTMAWPTSAPGASSE
jgi:SAM-dependent methyltransferase